MSQIFGREVRPATGGGTPAFTAGGVLEQDPATLENSAIPPAGGQEGDQTGGQEGDQNWTPVGDENANTGDEGGEQGSEETPAPTMESLALEVKEAQLQAKEAELIAREAQLSAQGQSNANSGEESEPEPPASVLAEVNPEELESEGERILYGVAEKLEGNLNETRQQLLATEKQAQEAAAAAQQMELESNITRVMGKYGVSRSDLETKFQETGQSVRNLDVLAQSIIFDKNQTQSGTDQTKKAQASRTQAVSKVGGNTGAPGANREGESNTGPRGGGKINYRDGAQIAQHYRGMTP